jgi:hypothetical protein
MGMARLPAGRQGSRTGGGGTIMEAAVRAAVGSPMGDLASGRATGRVSRRERAPLHGHRPPGPNPTVPAHTVCSATRARPRPDGGLHPQSLQVAQIEEFNILYIQKLKV